jgi:glyoxylase-like metal-dependent hydrolase (beta-lactamase superfamily II)
LRAPRPSAAAFEVGELTVTALRDGHFIAPPEYFGADDFLGHADLLDDDGVMRLPIGSFIVRGPGLGEKVVLIDAGLGDLANDQFVGGALPGELRAAGVEPGEVDVVICSHLHVDHCGGLYGEDGQAMFPNATLWFGQADWDHFVADGGGFMFEHIREGLKGAHAAERVEVIVNDTAVCPGITAVPAPGHTPGHVTLVLSSGEERAVLLGDAITCPIQLDEPAWSAISDVDPQLARRTRERLWDELDSTGVPAVGAHFPGLRFGRVLSGAGRRWST